MELSEAQKEIALEIRSRAEERKEKINMNKKILLSIMTIGLVAMLAGTGLYAYFSDTEKVGLNTITVGTLDIEVVTTPFALDDMKPCYTLYETMRSTT
ncbi:MAG: hypothetical protein IBV52_02945 [Candidatus Bathyarchaeota archaeon]